MLIDIWCSRNEQTKMFTYHRKKPVYVASRLDYVLLDTNISSWTSLVKIMPGFRSDHSSVIVQIDQFQIQRGRGFWRLNTQILYEVNYINAVNQILDGLSLEHIDSYREQWEIIKLQIIAESQKYSNARAENRRLIISQLEEKIQHYTRNVNQLNATEQRLFDKTKSDLESIYEQKAQSAIF